MFRNRRYSVGPSYLREIYARKRHWYMQRITHHYLRIVTKDQVGAVLQWVQLIDLWVVYKFRKISRVIIFLIENLLGSNIYLTYPLLGLVIIVSSPV